MRRLLDTQPSYLIRVARGGEVLAANDAALELLGVDERRQALGASLTRWIPPDQIEPWNEFVGRVVDGAPTSLETQLVLNDMHRGVVLHGIPLVDHPDGVASLLLSAHDISERVLLETTVERMRDAVQAAELRASQEEMRNRQLEADHAASLTLVAEATATRQSIKDRFAQLVIEHQAAQAATTRAHQDLARLQEELDLRAARLDAAATRQARLSAELLSTRMALEEQRKLTATAVADTAQIRQALEAAEAQSLARLDVAVRERQGRLAADSAADVDPPPSMDILALLQQQHPAEIVSREEQQRLPAEFETERGRLQALLDASGQELQKIQARHDAVEQQCRDCQSQWDAAVEDRRSLSARLHTLESEQQESMAAHAAERVRLEQLVAAAEAARDKQTEIAANRDVVVGAMAEQARRLAPLASTGSAARDLAPELRDLVERVDTLAGRVLEGCGLDNPGRADVELLRSEAVRAGTLTRELLRAGTDVDADSIRRVIIDRRKNKRESRP